MKEIRLKSFGDQKIPATGIGVLRFELSALDGKAYSLSYQSLPRQRRQVQSPNLALAVLTLVVVDVADVATGMTDYMLQSCG